MFAADLPGFTVLAETDHFIAGHIYEDAFLMDKGTGSKELLGDFYGNPMCALLDPGHSWCLMGGQYLLLRKNGETKKFPEETISWIHDMRHVGTGFVHILTDPWSPYSAVWEINIETEELVKLYSFVDYKEKPYSENVLW